MATEKESFVELTERIGRKVGGLSVYPFISSTKGSPDPVAYLMVSHVFVYLMASHDHAYLMLT
jgi:hypothetical protein